MDELKEGINALAEKRNMTRDELLEEYSRIIDEQREEINRLKAKVEKLSKRHPTTEEALAQYHFIKQNSQRNK
jgi:archaellum component FlaC